MNNSPPKKLSLPLLLLACLFAGQVQASVAVIIHPDNPNTLDERQLRNIYLGKSRTFPDGRDVTLLDLQPGETARDVFIQNVLRRSEANLSAYWARMLFSARGRPPQELAGVSAVKQKVSSDPSAIGYINADDVDDSVRVLMLVN